MAKKNFKNSARESVASAFFSQTNESTQDTQDTETAEVEEITKSTQDTHTAREGKRPLENSNPSTSFSLEAPNANLPPYRINLKLKGEFKQYLDQVSWESRMSITSYLNELIQKDLDRYQEEKNGE